MDRMYEENAKHAIAVVEEEVKIWEIASNPLALAYDNEMKDFLAHTCSQKVVSYKWKNYMNSAEGPMQSFEVKFKP